jgi:hypothetical protein
VLIRAACDHDGRLNSAVCVAWFREVNYEVSKSAGLLGSSTGTHGFWSVLNGGIGCQYIYIYIHDIIFSYFFLYSRRENVLGNWQ